MVALALLLSAPMSGLAHAEPVDDASRSTARALGESGIALYDAGDFASALVQFEKAEALVRVPTLSLRAARCLEQLGRWVQASERYLTTTALPIDATLPESYQTAQREAQTEAALARAALTQRIPSIEIVVPGPRPDEVRLDGLLLPMAALGAKRPVDRGEHVLRASRGASVTEQRATLAEGESLRVTLTLTDEARSAAKRERDKPPPPETLRTFGWVGVVTGAAVVAGGAATWTLAFSKQSALDAECPGGVCETGTLGEQARSDLDTYDTMRTASTVCFVGGGLLLGAGVAVLVATPRPRSAGAPTALALRLGPTGAALAGSF